MRREWRGFYSDTGTWTGEDWSDDAEFTQEDTVNTELARTLVNTTGDEDMVWIPTYGLQLNPLVVSGLIFGDRWDWDVWSGDEVCTLHTTSDGD